MKNKHPEIQKQHRLSQVYLKKFGYEHDNEWFVSVLKIGSHITENVKIAEFTIEENIFDLPYGNIEVRRYFEILSGKIENDYNRLINNIENQKHLIPKDKDLLNHFIPNILCRTKRFRGFIQSLIDDENEARKYLLDEITMFTGTESRYQTEILLYSLSDKANINILIGELMNHLVYMFRRFKKIILKSPTGYTWFTSDNPVYIDLQNSNGWLIPLEAEIYFPLSKEYCVFLYNNNSKLNSNPLRTLKVDTVNQVNFNLFDKLVLKITKNLDKYLIFGGMQSPTFIFK